jgi:hypothetical protein
MELAYSGLHQLCGPMLDHLDRLPVPQREALATVLRACVRRCARPVSGRASDAKPFGGRRRAAPLVCIVDDAQWLDQASAQILASSRAASSLSGCAGVRSAHRHR